MYSEARNLVVSLAARLESVRDPTGPPFLIALDGRSGVGKSTVAELLCGRLCATLVAGDDFYAGGTGIHHRSTEDLADICIDRAKLFSVLQHLKADRPARYTAFDWEAFDGSLAATPTIVDPRPFVVVEGVYAHHPDFRALSDFSVLLRASPNECERRLLVREGSLSEWERQWHRAEDWYFDNLAPPEAFDVVIDNE